MRPQSVLAYAMACSSFPLLSASAIVFASPATCFILILAPVAVATYRRMVSAANMGAESARQLFTA